MEPIVNGLETEFDGTVVFEQLNATDERRRTAMNAYSLRGHPSYVLLDGDGALSWHYSGPIDEPSLRAKLTELAP